MTLEAQIEALLFLSPDPVDPEALADACQVELHEAVTALEWDGEFWRVTVDALELPRIPSTTDVLGSYVVQLDEQGTLRGYKRTRRFQRGQPSDGE